MKTYKKSVIIAAIAARVLEIKSAYTAAMETVAQKAAAKVGDYIAVLADSGLTRSSDPVVISVSVPAPGQIERLTVQAQEIEARADVASEGVDTVLLDPTFAESLFTPGCFATTKRSLTVVWN